MRYLKHLTAVFFAATIGQAVLTSCEGGDLYNVDSPEWIAQRVDSIAAEKQKHQGGDEEIEGLNEDVYTIGATDYTSGWWASFSKDYPIKENEMWVAQFNLNINPAATNTYKNFALIITSDAHRGDAGYKEYGAIRFDNQPSGNSEWGDLIDRSCVESTLTFETDTDAGVDKLGGKVTLYIDRSVPGKFGVKMTNGTVTKTYIQNYEIANINDDPSNTTIRAFLVVEGSYINFIGSTLEPIGGYTSADDKLPLSMELKNMPKKVLLGTSIEDAFANLGATVNFETGVAKDVKLEDLTFSVIPDMETPGQKQIFVIYNKSFKGENVDKPISTVVTFEVVDKLYTSIGASDNSTGFWGAHSENIKVEPGETFISNFTNYTCGVSNWNNFCVVLVRADNSEYAVVRADNFGWGAGYDGNADLVLSGGQEDWGAWLAAMDGAKVTTAVTNNGDGTADVDITMIGNDGNTYTQFYHGINTVDADNFYFRFTVDGSHIEFDNVVGAEDNTTGFWGAHSENQLVPEGKTVSTQFINYTCGASNWNNFCVVLCRDDNSEYAVVRADNFGWGAGYDGNEGLVLSGGQEDWGAWLAAMDEAKVKVSVTNNGNGTADVNIIMVGNNGVTYYQDYFGINTIDVDNLWFRMTVDGSHFVFE